MINLINFYSEDFIHKKLKFVIELVWFIFVAAIRIAANMCNFYLRQVILCWVIQFPGALVVRAAFNSYLRQVGLAYTIIFSRVFHDFLIAASLKF